MIPMLRFSSIIHLSLVDNVRDFSSNGVGTLPLDQKLEEEVGKRTKTRSPN